MAESELRKQVAGWIPCDDENVECTEATPYEPCLNRADHKLNLVMNPRFATQGLVNRHLRGNTAEDEDNLRAAKEAVDRRLR